MNCAFQVLGDFGEGGDGTVAWGIAAGLQSRGVRAICVALKQGGTAGLEDKGLQTLQLSANQLASMLGAIRKFRRAVRRESPELIHVHGVTSLAFVTTSLTGMRKPEIWFTWHDSGNVLHRGGLRGKIERWAIGRCTRVFGSSRDVADRLRAALNGRKDVEVFRNGIAPAEESSAVCDPKPLIVWAGRFVPPKAPGELVEALGEIAAKDVPFYLTMLGSALPHQQWLYDEVMQKVSDLGLQARASFPGWVDNPHETYAHASIGVQTSHTEGLSMALLEQMMAGLCIVATDVGDTNVAIEHEESGLLIPPNDHKALVSALDRVLSDEELRVRLAHAARRRAVAEFSHEAMATRTLEMYGSPSDG